ncbi:undecaprenyl-diphosphate phosphatase [Galbitalea soli]|uniref:Undecaprenyl-diphosphatase n=1 Tax=Galbitalea soli TaxID=1268042 RepID=A0A7C9TP61_9MICO|nr:undecaprenyl-diphosphate phosphatase [Galbitalea soli]NYJ30768.1 undecaprenyl-diphosphatase [Galbitalea soli]
MHFLDAIILGIVQGLTEFLPISSSAHLRIVGELLRLPSDPGAAFTAVIQLGTELAVLIYFWRDITTIIGKWVRALFRRVPQSDPDVRLGWFIILGSLPIVILGVLFQNAIETTFRSLWIVAVTMIVFGIILGIADAVGAKTKTLADLSWPQAVGYGFAQALALIPGVSRSGGTISAGLFMGYERPAAARYSFLLALPAVFGSGFYELYKLAKGVCAGGATTCPPEIFTPLEIGAATVVAFVVGFLVIAFFMRYISRRSFLPFVVYRILLGVVLIIALSTGALAA